MFLKLKLEKTLKEKKKRLNFLNQKKNLSKLLLKKLKSTSQKDYFFQKICDKLNKKKKQQKFLTKKIKGNFQKDNQK